jgi:hypothetical protein
MKSTVMDVTQLALTIRGSIGVAAQPLKARRAENG